jgi:hypothetical protein
MDIKMLIINVSLAYFYYVFVLFLMVNVGILAFTWHSWLRGYVIEIYKIIVKGFFSK